MATVTVLNGLVGGLVATLVMTAFMISLGDDSPPPTAVFWSQYVADGPPENYAPQGQALHLGYGTVAGVVFALLLPAIGFASVSLPNGVLLGLGWGVVLFVGAAAVWMNVVLDLDAEPRAVALFLLFHLVYGAVLGGVVGYGLL